MRRGAWFGVVAGGTGYLLACGAFTASSTVPGPIPDAASTCDADTTSDPHSCGSCGHACGSNEACQSGKCVAGCPGGVVYVASSGSDQNTGCDQSTPKATIGGAIAFVKTLEAKGQEIHVCRGTYIENGLVLDYPVTLRGGYECALWTRHDPFGWTGFNSATGRATPFDPTNESIIEAGSAPNAIDVSGAPITSAVTIEGFTIRGRATGGGNGVVVHGGASPVLASDQITGAATGILAGSTAGSIGVDIADTAAPEITHCIINGGGGGDPASATVHGSVGVVVATTGPSSRVHDNEIDGGTGVSASTAAIGVDVQEKSMMLGGDALARNAIFFSGATAGSAATGTPVAGLGLIVRPGAQADIRDNGIYGGKLTCTGTMGCEGFGVFVGGVNSIVQRNRVFLGDGTGSQTPPVLWGVYLDGGTTPNVMMNVTVANNLVVAGPSTVTAAFGIEVTGAATLINIVHNTIVAQAPVNSQGVNDTAGANIIVDDNLIVGTTFGLVTTQTSCTRTAGTATVTNKVPASIHNNAFVDVTSPAALVTTNTDGTCTAGTTPLGVQDLESQVPAAKDNVTFAETCDAADPICHTCTDHPTCISDVFAETPSLATVIAADAKLAPNVSCAIATGGGALDPSVSVDLNSAPRTGQVSIGAAEDDAACTL